MANTNSSSNGSLLSGETKKELLPPTSTSVSNLTSISQTTVSESIKTESSTLTTTTTTPKTTTTPAPAAINTSGAPPPQPAHLSNSDIRWIFSLDKIEQSPSRLDGVSRESELQERQEAALFINDLGIKLKVYVIRVLSWAVSLDTWILGNVDFINILEKCLLLLKTFLKSH